MTEIENNMNAVERMFQYIEKPEVEADWK